MHDTELKKLLLETHPVRPGQEERAWAQLQNRFSASTQPTENPFFWGWRGMVGTSLFTLLAVAVMGFELWRWATPTSFASAASQSPGIYATAFYSHSAHAQVVWLDGMEPASDRLSYMDPTTVVAGQDSAEPANDPNGL